MEVTKGEELHPRWRGVLSLAGTAGRLAVLWLEQRRGKCGKREVGVGGPDNAVSVHRAVPLSRPSDTSCQEPLKTGVVSRQHSWLLTQNGS